MITYEEFQKRVVEDITTHYEKVGTPVSVETSKVHKNNGITLTGVVVRMKDKLSNVSPTIYLDGFYSDYERGRSYERVVEAIIELNDEHQPSDSFEISKFLDFNQVKSHIKCKLINTAWNKELLEDVPHKDILDMSIIFMVEVDDFKDGSGTITIHNQHLEDVWHISEGKLIEVALDNIKREQFQITNMMSVIAGLEMDGDFTYDRPEDMTPDDMMYVLTNQDKLFGASVIMRQDYLERVASVFRCDMFILPSSIHELIVIPAWDESKENVEQLKHMVHEVNTNEVQMSERLSDNVYLYHYDSKEITIAE